VQPRSFFLIGGLDLIARLTVDRPGVKELAALSGASEESGPVVRQ
jgi:hypothetical protein